MTRLRRSHAAALRDDHVLGAAIATFTGSLAADRLESPTPGFN
jgi:hypothetical protein